MLLLDGRLHGTTKGGAQGDGTLFRYRVADGACAVLASFDPRTTGAFREDDVVASADGRTPYGLTRPAA